MTNKLRQTPSATTTIRRLLAALLLGWVWLLAAPSARAQALDEISVQSDNGDAIIRIKFNVRIQYQRHAPVGTTDLVEIYFTLLGTDELLTRPVEETLISQAVDRVPGVTVTYPVQTGVKVKEITVRFTQRVALRVRPGSTNQTLDIVLPGLAPRPAAAAQPGAPAVERDRYAIVLQSVPLAQQSEIRPVPARFQDYTVFSSQTLKNGVLYYELDLGYFDTAAEAEKIRQSALRDFPDAQVFDVVQRKEQTLQQAAAQPPAPLAPAPVPPPAAAPAPATPAPPAVPETELDKQASALITKARESLAAGGNDVAINALNQLLLLPPNKFSQDAQELIGVARERAGDSARARQEYELYLRLFPTGDGATRVRQRLASLAPPEVAPGQPPTEVKPGEARVPTKSFSGGVSQYYYGGKSKVTSTFANVPTTVNEQTISNTTQSSLVTTADLSGRYRNESSDTRVVVRDTDQKSFIETAPSLNRLDAAYVDYRSIAHGFSVKLGRQTGVTGGLLGRFDGAIVGVDVAPKWRLNVVGGVPVDKIVDAKQRFEGINVEAQNLADHWGGDAFLINQTADGVVDRRAAGGEVRYFDQRKTLYSLLDYDVNYHALNAATVQGTYQLPDQTTFSLLYDNRKAPPLQTSNALIQSGCDTITQMETSICPSGNGPYTLDQIKTIAKSITAASKQYSLGVTRPLTAKWQASGDVRLTNVGPLPAIQVNSQLFPAQPGTGNVWTYDLQATGSNLYSKRDINVFTLTHLNGPVFRGNQFGYNNLIGILDNRMTLEPSINFYRQDDTQGNKLTRVSPGFRTTYKLLPRMSIEGDVSLEHSKTEGPTQSDTTTNTFYYVGYRYDLQ
jgi:tetratricopeptide (TPR) repeat protein